MLKRLLNRAKLSYLERFIWREGYSYAAKQGVRYIEMTMNKKRVENSNILLSENPTKIFLIVEENPKAMVNIGPLIEYVPEENKYLKRYREIKNELGESANLYKIRLENIF